MTLSKGISRSRCACDFEFVLAVALGIERVLIVLTSKPILMVKRSQSMNAHLRAPDPRYRAPRLFRYTIVRLNARKRRIIP